MRLIVLFLLWAGAAYAQPDRAQPSSNPVACPGNDASVFWILGQSNAANHGQGTLAEQPDSNAYMMLDGQCYPIADPVAGCTGNQGSWVSRFAVRYAAETGKPVVVLCAAAGGYSVADWLNDLHGQWTYASGQVAASPLQIDYVIYQGGEADADAGTRLGAYFYAMLDLRARFATVTPAPLVLTLSTRIRGRTSDIIRRAQILSVTNGTDTFLGVDSDHLNHRWRLPDDTHYNSDGLAYMGEWMSDRIRLITGG